MAVEDKYTDANIVAGKKASPFKTSGGAKVVALVGVVTVAVADDDGSKYRVFKDIPSTYVPLSISVNNTAITAGTDYEFGLYKTGVGGAVISKGCLATGVDMSAARLISTANNVGFTAITLGELKTLGELSTQTAVDSAYDLVLTADTVGSAAGTIRVTALFAYA